MPAKGVELGIAGRVKDELYRRGMVPAELADRMREAGLRNRASVYRLLSGETNDPRLSTVLGVAQVLGADVSHLLGYSPAPSSRIQDFNWLAGLPDKDKHLAIDIMRTVIKDRKDHPKDKTKG